MRTKFLFFLLIFVMGAGKGFAQSASADSLLQEIEQARSFLENWDTIPGSQSDRILAFMTGTIIQIGDSIRRQDERYLGFLLPKNYRYKRYVQYDKVHKVFKVKLDLVEKTNDIDRITFLTIVYSFLVFCLVYFTRQQYREKINIAWGPWAVVIGFLLFFSHYLGSLLTISSLIYIFKDEIRESIENFLQKRKERKERKEKSKKQKKD